MKAKAKSIAKLITFMVISTAFTLTAFASGDVTYKLDSDWGTAFQAGVTVTNNTAQAYEDWELEFDFSHNITNIWNASILEHTGNHYKVGNLSWNGSLGIGASTSFGFGGAPGGTITEPFNLTLNGKATGNTPTEPIANNDNVQTDESTAVTVDVLSNDTGENITLANITQPGNGSVYIQGNQTIYTPTADFFGNDSFTYTIEDSNGQWAIATVSVAVKEISEPVNPVNNKKMVNGYFAEWSIYDRDYQVTDIPVEHITHINYAFLRLKDGIVQIWDEWAAVDKRFPEVETHYGTYPAGDWNGTKEYYGNFERLNRLDELVNEYYNKDVKIMAAIGGWTGSDDFPEMTRTSESRKKFIDSLVVFLKKYKFEGVCIDWEFPVLGTQFSYSEARPEESDQLVALTKETREAFDKLTEETGVDYEIIVSFNCAEKNIKDIDLKAISGYADHLDIMTFDVVAVAWGNAAGHQSPIYHNPANPDSFNDPTFQQGTVNASVQYLLSIGVPREKINICSPQYGRSGSEIQYLFQEGGSPGGGTWEAAAYDYDSVLGKSNKINLPTDPSFYYWDDVAQASYYINNDGEFISYDSLQAVEAKCKYIKEQDLGGWCILEYSGNRDAELVKTAYISLNPGL